MPQEKSERDCGQAAIVIAATQCERFAQFSECEHHRESIHCLVMPAKTHRGDAPTGRISCRLGKILDVNSIAASRNRRAFSPRQGLRRE
jgi:hypothetical protein